ncbi:MAG: hypothetical protein KBG28_00785 [Kofleriaceae bacterium]|nr:hypothetical protein [Kofleriaceae bacterium]
MRSPARFAVILSVVTAACVGDEEDQAPAFEPAAAQAAPQLLALDGAPAAAVLALTPADPCAATSWTVRLGTDLAGPACAWLERALRQPLPGGTASIHLRNPARRLDLTGVYVESVTWPLADRAQAGQTGVDLRLRAASAACKPTTAAALAAADAEALARAKRSSRADRFIATLGDGPKLPARVVGETKAQGNLTIGDAEVAYNESEADEFLAWIDSLAKRGVTEFDSSIAYTLADGVPLVELLFTADQLEHYGARLRARASVTALRCRPR